MEKEKKYFSLPSLPQFGLLAISFATVLAWPTGPTPPPARSPPPVSFPASPPEPQLPLCPPLSFPLGRPSLAALPSSTAARASAVDDPAPPIGAVPHLPRPALGQSRNRRHAHSRHGSVSPCPGLYKTEPSPSRPPCCLPAPVSHLPSAAEAENRRTDEPRSAVCPSVRTAVPEPPPPPFSPR